MRFFAGLALGWIAAFITVTFLEVALEEKEIAAGIMTHGHKQYRLIPMDPTP